MGNLFTSPKLNGKILITGLDACGKTTLLYRWKLGEIVTVIPTIGFNVEEIELPSSTKGQVVSVTAWDAGGRAKIRPLLRHYYKDMECVVFIIDSRDKDRVEEAAFELQAMCSEEELAGIPFLILCNKQDIPGALSPNELVERIDLPRIQQQRRVCVMGVSAITGVGLKESLWWIDHFLNDKDRVSDAFKKQATHIPLWPDYDVTNENATLQKFSKIKYNTECPFAKTAKLWGGKPVLPGLPLDEQAKANVAALSRFVYECRPSGGGSHPDGFCVEIDHPQGREGGPREFGECVRVFLTPLSDLDPNKEFVMRVKNGGIGRRGWRFRFAGADFFVTTFAPCYPVTSSRYAFGTGCAFLLLQPESSFLKHNLPPDTAETNWATPQTIRDKTRVAYQKAGRPYYIPNTIHYPPAEHIVKPLRDDGVQIIQWWEPTPLHHLK